MRSLGFVTDTAIDARGPRKAGHVIADVVVIAHPPPPTRPKTLAQLPRRVADEPALVAPPPLHIVRGGANYFDFERPPYVY